MFTEHKITKLSCLSQIVCLYVLAAGPLRSGARCVEPRRGVVQLRYCLRNRVRVLDHVEVSLCLVRLPAMVGPPHSFIFSLVFK